MAPKSTCGRRLRVARALGPMGQALGTQDAFGVLWALGQGQGGALGPQAPTAPLGLWGRAHGPLGPFGVIPQPFRMECYSATSCGEKMANPQHEWVAVTNGDRQFGSWGGGQYEWAVHQFRQPGKVLATVSDPMENCNVCCPNQVGRCQDLQACLR